MRLLLTFISAPGLVGSRTVLSRRSTLARTDNVKVVNCRRSHDLFIAVRTKRLLRGAFYILEVRHAHQFVNGSRLEVWSRDSYYHGALALTAKRLKQGLVRGVDSFRVSDRLLRPLSTFYFECPVREDQRRSIFPTDRIIRRFGILR